MTSTLYICYFGVREPLVQTQVLPYLREVKKDGVDVSLLTFEPDFKNKWSKSEVEEQRAHFADEGITWHVTAYHKTPSVPATAFDIFNGARIVWSLLRKNKYDILHGRVHIPTLMGALARKFSGHKPKLLFDIRGFFPEEYTDAGRWPENGIIYRTAKRIEKWLMKESDGFVVLTEKAREILFPESKETGRDKLGRPVEVIPCCVDMERFKIATPEMRQKMRSELKLDGRNVVVYVGSFGGWYLTEETADLFAAAKKLDPSTFAMILTQSDPQEIKPLLLERGFTDADMLIQKVPSNELPKYLCAADVAVSFIKKCYSKQASSPTKNAEYLACGLPIIANSGVGDVDSLILDNQVGVLIDTFETNELVAAVEKITDLGDIGEKCRQTSRELFDLKEIGGTRYRNLYGRITGELK